MRRQRKSAIDVSGEEDALTLARLRFDLVPRDTRRSMGNESPIDQIIDVILPNHRGHPIALDPVLRQSGPLRRSARSDFLAFACAVAFFARSRAPIFSFTIAADEARTDQQCLDENRDGGRIREGRGKVKAHCSKALGRLSDHGFRQTLKVRTLGCARRSCSLPLRLARI